VEVSGGEVELKGTVKHEAQRRRAADLVETTAGVQAVNDGLKVEEP
jgi:osmotically-inducible protein OsmY